MADIGTTALAIRDGFVEGNPILSGLNVPQIAAVKIGITQAFKFAPNDFCYPGLWGLTAAGYGAALWNIGVMLGSGPAALPVIIGLFWWQYDDWYRSSVRSCNDPWHFEPVTFFHGFHDKF